MIRTILIRVTAFAVSGAILVGTAASTSAQINSLSPKPWPNKQITISFAPDWVEIGRYRNELNQHMNDQLSDPDWRIESLRAFQTWSRHCDLQFALAPESARAFGIPALAQGDPRFGDIRIGAFPQQNVLGNASPYHPSLGAWAGDIFLDTTREFYIHDWNSDEKEDERYDLFSVMLHEAGNSLGLVDQYTNLNSVMFAAYVGPRHALGQADIEDLQKLYGAPSPDPYERESRNESPSTATPIAFPPDFSTTLVATIDGRIQDGSDVDVFRFSGVTDAQNCWIKLRVHGRSLFCGRITAYNADFEEIDTINAESPLANTIGKEITNIEPGETVYVVVESAGISDFDFGDYQLALDFNVNGGVELETANGIEEDDDDDDEAGRFFEADDAALTNALYALHGLVDRETRSNNGFARATRLWSAFGLSAGSRFEVIAALASPDDRDMYRILTSEKAADVLTVDLVHLGLETTPLDLAAFDENRQPLPVTRTARDNGNLQVIVEGIQPDSNVFLRIQHGGKSRPNGNYLMVVDVATRMGELETIENVTLGPSDSDRFGSFTTYKTQLIQFEVRVSSEDAANQGCLFTIYSDTGRVESAVAIQSGRGWRGFVWLPAGTHYLRFTSLTRNERDIVPAVIKVDSAIASDDEGPILLDPSGNPISGAQVVATVPTPTPTWTFPEFLTGLMLPVETPW